MFEIVRGLSYPEQQAIKHYYLDNWSAQESAHAGGMSLDTFRNLKRRTRALFLSAVACVNGNAMTATAGGGWLQ